MQADGPQQAESSKQGAARPMNPMAPGVVVSSQRVASELSLVISPSAQQEESAALKRDDTEVVPDVRLPPQQSPELLAMHNVRVRDFAYECILPPLPSVRRFRQLAPASRPFKRTKRSHGNGDDFLFGGVLNMSPNEGMLSEPSSQEGEDERGRPLQRKATEPVIPTEGPTTGPSRTGAYMDVTQYQRLSQSQSQPQRSDFMPSRSPAGRPSLLIPSQSPSTPPPMFVSGHTEGSLLLATTLQPSENGQFEDNDMQIATPLVTPHGSFSWESNSASVVPPTTMQPSPMEDVTRSPPSSFVWQPTPAQTTARVSTPRVPSKSKSIRLNGSVSQLSPMSSLTSLPVSPAAENAPLLDQPPTPSLSPRSRGAHLLRTDHSQSLLSSMSSLTSLRSSPPPATSPLSAGPSPIASPAPEPEPRTSPPPRYFLRARSNSGRRTGAPSPAPKSRSTRGALPYPRYSAVTRQSAHSRSPKSSDSPPRAKPLKRAVA